MRRIDYRIGGFDRLGWLAPDGQLTDLPRKASASLEVVLAAPAASKPQSIPGLPSIIPSPGSPPGPVNVSGITYLGPTHTVAAGDYVYTQTSLQVYSVGSGGTLTINGSVWSFPTSGSGTISAGADVINNGTVVVKVVTPDDLAKAFHQHNAGFLINTGSVFAISEQGRAEVINSNSITLDNSGLLAAQALGGLAVVVNSYNSGVVTNQVGGRILAEGVGAIAIYMGRGSVGSDVVNIDNAGLIQAVSIDPTGEIGSTAISVAHLTHETIRVVNSGVIKADWAFISDDNGVATVTQAGVDIIINQAGGVIEGLIFMGRGADVIENAGTLRGPVVSMGEGDDLFDTRSGTVEGIVLMDWGDDRFLGSAGADQAVGDRGDDILEGNGGDDLLMGGFDDDVLTGGAGNDGLFGEYGDDRIVTQGGDVASGGAGDDRIELGDYTFGLIHGGSGYDTLVLPTGARQLDLSAVAAEEAILAIEEIVLGGGKEVVVRAADIAAFTDGGTTLRLEGTATDTIHLIGAWAAAGTVVLDGVTWRKFILDGKTILVEGPAVVDILATSPIGAAGLDPVAGGAPAPLPGPDGPLPYTPTDTFMIDFDLTQSVTVHPEELWWNDGLGSVVQSETGAVLTNRGAIASVSAWNFPVVTAVQGPNLELINHGEISAVWLWDDNYSDQNEEFAGFARAVVAIGKITNYGLVEALTLHGTSLAVVAA